MAHKYTDRQNESTKAQIISNGSFAVEEVEGDPTRRGYTIVPNYFAYFWTPLLGAKAALTYERICSFAHGKKEESYPSIGLLADILGVDRHDLTGRIRRDRRAGRRSEYYQTGLIQQLAEAGLLRVEIQQRGGPHYKFTVLKHPPLLTPEQLAQLPLRLQHKHQELLDRCQKDREAFARTAFPTKPRGGDAATGDLNTTDLTAQNNSLPPATSTEEALVRAFYQQIGQPKVSRQKIESGVRILSDLQKQGFRLPDIMWAMTWIVSHQDLFGGKVHSLALLPQVIGQALQSRSAEKQRHARIQQQSRGEQQLKAEQARRQELERLYQSLSPTEQAALREVAVDNLLSNGMEKRFLLEPIIRGEVCRLLKEDHGSHVRA